MAMSTVSIVLVTIVIGLIIVAAGNKAWGVATRAPSTEPDFTTVATHPEIICARDGPTSSAAATAVAAAVAVGTAAVAADTAEADLTTFLPAEAATLKAGDRVVLHGLQKTPELNGIHGVVIRYETSTTRYVVRKEVAHFAEGATVTVRPTNLAAALPLAGALQDLVDAAPAGARVTLCRGTVSAEKLDATAGDADDAPTLTINTAITLSGMGCRSGGTVLAFGVSLGSDATGELAELSHLHVNGVVDISPRDVSRVRLVKVSITAPSSDQPALYLDEISRLPLARAAPSSTATAAEDRVVVEECWVRGGSVGIWINAVGCVLRRCRVQNARTFGVQSNADFSLEACTIGNCAMSGAGGGILTRACCTQLRSRSGVNENRIQRDGHDKEYSGYDPNDCRGCVGKCACSAMFAVGSMVRGEGMVRWSAKGEGRWQRL